METKTASYVPVCAVSFCSKGQNVCKPDILLRDFPAYVQIGIVFHLGILYNGKVKNYSLLLCERKEVSPMKRTLVTVAALVLSLALIVTGTIAYLTDTDSDVNVMTLGNVAIQQLEKERADGVEHNAEATDGSLKSYEQEKPLFPAYPAGGDSSYDVADEPFVWGEYVTAEGAENPLWDDAALVGVLDKMVFVENTGDSDCYYRTWLAFECPEGMTVGAEDADILYNANSNITLTSVGYDSISVDGKDVRFAIYCAEYADINDGVLKPDEISLPSLLQVAMSHECGNEKVALLGDTYEVLALSQACQTTNMPDYETALNASFGEVKLENQPWADEEVSTEIQIEYNGDAPSLHEELAAATDAASGNVTITLTENYDLSEMDWTPIYVDGYHGAGIITVEGNGHYITGLKAPLFKGGFAGKSGIVIKDLTIIDSEIVSSNTQGSGAFIECTDSMTEVTLTNCHLKDSTLTGSRTGGLVGWTSGYSKKDDGPVKSYITIEDCSVTGCTITGTSVGAINGHAGASDWTYTTIKNCTISDNQLNSIDDGGWRVGVVVGTANVGEVTISGITESGNTLTQTGKTAPAGQSNLYGRFVPGSTGKLVINGVAIQ